jgi:hypothetical protein
MAGMIPEDKTRLYGTMFVHESELSAIGPQHVIRGNMKRLAERAFAKLIEDCIVVEDGEPDFPGKVLRLDVYIFSPKELEDLLCKARRDGERDAIRWGRTGLRG